MAEYTIANEPLLRDDEEHLPVSMTSEVEDLFYKIKKGKPTAKKKLEKLIKRFPNVPMLLNFLVIWYNANGDKENARRINEEAYKKFPNYLFAITNKVAFNIEDLDSEEIKKLLGNEPFDISNLYPDRNVFHFTEYQAYSSAVIQYLAASRRTDEALSYLKNLDTDNVTTDFFNAMENLISRYEIRFATERWKAAHEKDKLKSANEREEPTLTQADEPLEPKNLRYTYLYDTGLWDIDFEQLEKDITEDCAGLIAEMNYALQRAAETAEYNYEIDIWEPVALHAILLLGYLDPKNGFEKTLLLLQQPYELSEQYIEDWGSDVLSPYFLRPFDGILPMIKEFILAPLTPTFSKIEIIGPLQLLANANNVNLPQVHQLLEDTMTAFLNQQQNPDLMDWNVTAFLAMAAIDTKATHLLPIIKELFDTEWLSPEVAGDYNDIVKLMHEEKPNKVEFFDDPISHLKYLSETDNKLSERNSNTDFDDEDDFDDFYDDDFYDESFYDFYNDSPEESFSRPQLPSLLGNLPGKKSNPIIKNPYEGASRNAPCPCGSGKKYKRCHGA